MTIYETWAMSKKQNLKVRYKGWSNIKYFTCESINFETQTIHGYLDTGEVIHYGFNTKYFEIYYPGAEFNAILV